MNSVSILRTNTHECRPGVLKRRSQYISIYLHAISSIAAVAFCVYRLHTLINVQGGWWAIVFLRFLSQLDRDKHGAPLVHTASIFTRMRWQALLIHILNIIFCL